MARSFPAVVASRRVVVAAAVAPWSVRLRGRWCYEGGATVSGEQAGSSQCLPVSRPTHVSHIAPVRQPAGRAPQLAVPAPQPAELAGAGAQLCWEGREGGGGPRGGRRPARERGREGQGAAFARSDTTARVQVGGWSTVHLGFVRGGGDRLGGDAAAGEGAAAASNRRRRGTIIAARQALAWPRWHCRQALASCHEIQLWHASKQQWRADGGRLGGNKGGLRGGGHGRLSAIDCISCQPFKIRPCRQVSTLQARRRNRPVRCSGFGL